MLDVLEKIPLPAGANGGLTRHEGTRTGFFQEDQYFIKGLEELNSRAGFGRSSSVIGGGVGGGGGGGSGGGGGGGMEEGGGGGGGSGGGNSPPYKIAPLHVAESFSLDDMGEG
jgi:hypothetical protein